MKFSKPALIAAVSTALTFPTISSAEEQSPIIVTATRTAQTADESLASVTVITSEQIAQQQPNDLHELLTGISGIDIANSGGIGKSTSIYMRGTNASHVLFLVDGVRIGSATLGTPSIQDIPVDLIERIEIVRGPRASLYGSDAIGGVIQIFTKKGSKKETASITISSGSYKTRKLLANISASAGSTKYNVSASQLETEGFNALKTSDQDLDGYNNSSIGLNVKHSISDKSYLDFNFQQSKGLNEYDDSYTASNIKKAEFVQQITGIKYYVPVSTNWNMTISSSQSEDRSDNFTNAKFVSKFNTTKTNALWQNDITVSDNQLLTFGVDFLNDSVVSSTNYNKTSRDNSAVFIQHQLNGDSNDLQIALRNDNNQSFGAHLTGNLAWGYNFSNKFRAIASYGTGFKAPTFNNLYYPSSGNPNIKPEESESFEIELRGKYTKTKWGISLYQNNISNLIVYPAPTYAVTNVGSTRINGVDFSLSTQLAGWNTQLEASFLDPRNTDTNKFLARRTQQSLRLNLDKRSGKWTTGLSIISQGYRFDDTKNTKRLDGYNLITLRASYAVSKKMSIKWKIENLFDAQYETAKNYSNPGVSGYISIIYKGF